MYKRPNVFDTLHQEVFLVCSLEQWTGGGRSGGVGRESAGN